MRKLLITPKVGIGALKLGMSPEQILDAINEELSDLPDVTNRNMQIAEEKEGDGVTRRYIKGSFFFMVHYRNNEAIELSVNRDVRETMKVILYDIDVFLTKAEEIVNQLKERSRYIYDGEDELLGTDYDFHDIGIRFWRDGVFHEKLLLDKDYMEEMQFVIEEEYRYLYFDIVTVKQIE